MKTSTKALLIIIPGGIVLFLAYRYFFSGVSPAQVIKGASQWWQAKLGQLPPGTKIEDITGDAGTNAETTAMQTVTNNHSQGFYNAALQQFSYDAGNNSALDSQGTPGWPWHSYSEWISLQYPALPSAGSVTVDSDGVYHNDYQ